MVFPCSNWACLINQDPFGFEGTSIESQPRGGGVPNFEKGQSLQGPLRLKGARAALVQRSKTFDMDQKHHGQSSLLSEIRREGCVLLRAPPLWF